MNKSAIRNALFSLSIGLLISSAFAKTTIATPSMSDVYSQPTFDTRPLVVNWLPSITTQANLALLSIDSASELNQLFALKTDKAPIVSVFFVSAIKYCGGKIGTFDGCAAGTSIAVIDSTEDGGLGVISHELGHVLGLDHVAAENNLMHSPTKVYLLDKQQVATIRTSSLISDNSISLRPISLSPVPEPASILMLFVGCIVVARFGHREQLTSSATTS